MDVYFTTQRGGVSNRAVHQIGKKQLILKKGITRITDKDFIKEILRSEVFKRGEILLASDPELVQNYLQGKNPDYITEALTEQITDDGIRELAALFNVKFVNQPVLARAEIVGREVTTAAQEIIARSMRKEGETTLLDDFIEAGVVTYNKPWYKSEDGKLSTRTKAEAEMWCIDNQDKLLVNV